ncbi:MAG TPA: transporter [Solirubrobacter sp.]
MIWLTWRQSRAQVASVAGAVAALLAFLVISGTGLPAFDDTYLQDLVRDGFAKAIFYLASFGVLFLPAIVGTFWGAPLVARELEAGTHRLAWNQSVTRTRWLAMKASVIALVAVVTTAGLSLGLTWWCGSLDKAINAGQTYDGPLRVGRIAPPMFEARGIAPIGYTLFALALGVAAGLVVRRVVPAMAITLAVFVAVQILMPTFVRGHIGATSQLVTIKPENMTGMSASVGPGNRPLGARDLQVRADEPGAWTLANETVDRAGRVHHTLPNWFAFCVPGAEGRIGPGPDPQMSAACFARAAREGWRQRITFMPASRYWTLQAIELAIFLALTGALTAFSFWWLRHRLT